MKNVKKYKYSLDRKNPVSLQEYLVYSEDSHDKYALFKLKNNLKEELNMIELEVSEYDTEGGIIKTSLFSYGDLKVKGKDVFVPYTKFKLQAITETITVGLKNAKFKRSFVENGVYVSTKTEKSVDKDIKMLNLNGTKRAVRILAGIATLGLIAGASYFIYYNLSNFKDETKELEIDDYKIQFGKDKKATILSYAKDTKDLVIPKTINEFEVVALGDFFAKDKAYETVEINVEGLNIGNEAFSGCTTIKSFKATSLGTIGYGAFRGLNDTTFSIGDAKSVEKYAFKDCAKLSSVDFKSCTTVSEYAFDGCDSLSSILVPNSLLNSYSITQTELKELSYASSSVFLSRVFTSEEAKVDVLTTKEAKIEKNSFKGLTINNLNISDDTEVEYGALENAGISNYEINDEYDMLGNLILATNPTLSESLHINKGEINKYSLKGIHVKELHLATDREIDLSLLENQGYANKIYLYSTTKLKGVGLANLFPSEVYLNGNNSLNGEAFKNTKIIVGDSATLDAGSLSLSGVKQVEVMSDATIKENAFNGCKDLEELKMPASIEVSKLGDMPKLKKLIVSGKVTVDSFYNKDIYIEELVIDSSVDTLEYTLVSSNVSSLKKLHIPSTLGTSYSKLNKSNSVFELEIDSYDNESNFFSDINNNLYSLRLNNVTLQEGMFANLKVLSRLTLGNYTCESNFVIDRVMSGARSTEFNLKSVYIDSTDAVVDFSLFENTNVKNIAIINAASLSASTNYNLSNVSNIYANSSLNTLTYTVNTSATLFFSDYNQVIYSNYSSIQYNYDINNTVNVHYGDTVYTYSGFVLDDLNPYITNKSSVNKYVLCYDKEMLSTVYNNSLVLSKAFTDLYIREKKQLTATVNEYGTITVKFQNENGSLFKNINCKYGDKIEYFTPTTTLTNTHFLYWTLNGEEFNFDKELTENTTLVAKFYTLTHTGEFDHTFEIKSGTTSVIKDIVMGQEGTVKITVVGKHEVTLNVINGYGSYTTSKENVNQFMTIYTYKLSKGIYTISYSKSNYQTPDSTGNSYITVEGINNEIIPLVSTCVAKQEPVVTDYKFIESDTLYIEKYKDILTKTLYDDKGNAYYFYNGNCNVILNENIVLYDQRIN